MSPSVDFRTLADALNGRTTADVACLWCGPDRSTKKKRERRVLRLWGEQGFISFHCARCGKRGYVCDGEQQQVDRDALRRAREITHAREAAEGTIRIRKARTLWRMRQRIAGTPADRYLRKARGIIGPLPPTLGCLPPRGEYPPALIAAFGVPTEPEPG